MERIAFAVVVVMLMFVALASPLRRFVVGRFAFQPSPGVDLSLSDLGVVGEEVRLEAEDGVSLHGFFIPHPGADRAILFLHGNAGNASHRLPNAVDLSRQASHVLLIDYRGYGRSGGRPDEAGVYADARAGLTHLIEERGIPEQRIVLFGRSLGGAVAVDLARGRALGGVILESTFPSLSEVGGAHMGPAARWLARGMFDSGSKITGMRAPLLAFHGDRDGIVPYALGRQLFEMAPEPKAFETITGAGHNDTVQVGGRAYFARIGRFLDRVTPRRG